MAYGFAMLAGFMLMVSRAFSGDTIWLCVVMPFVLLSHVFQSNRALLVAVLLFVAVKVVLAVSGQNGGFVWWDFLFFTGAALAFWGINAKCPRCRLHVAMYKTPWWNDLKPLFCNCCGRTRQGVRPLQYLLKPEPWDGEYHDEGGGPASDEAHTEWRRYIMQQRWLRRLKNE